MIAASPADRLSKIRRRLRDLRSESAHLRRSARERWAVVDRLLDEWIDVAGVPARPVAGWPSERPPEGS